MPALNTSRCQGSYVLAAQLVVLPGNVARCPECGRFIGLTPRSPRLFRHNKPRLADLTHVSRRFLLAALEHKEMNAEPWFKPSPRRGDLSVLGGLVKRGYMITLHDHDQRPVQWQYMRITKKGEEVALTIRETVKRNQDQASEPDSTPRPTVARPRKTLSSWRKDPE